jgi:hypothetical protein
MIFTAMMTILNAEGRRINTYISLIFQCTDISEGAW